MKEISICIPTFERKKYLEQAVTQMIEQIERDGLEDEFEIVIFNDNGHDETDQYLRSLVKKYSCITYVMQKKRLGLRKAIEFVPDLAAGRYIWFFSDDDIPTKGSLNHVVNLLRKKKPGIIFGNVDDFDGHKIVSPNMLRMDQDVELSTRKEFFHFLSKKMGSITYFTTYISNFIIRRDFYEKHSSVNTDYDSPLNMTPLVAPFFYTKMECPVIVTKKSIVCRRTDNESWIDPDPIAHTVRSYKTSGFHFGNIQRLNMWDIPPALHLYFIAHAIERTVISIIIQIPFGLQLIRSYWRFEKKVYSLVFGRQ